MSDRGLEATNNYLSVLEFLDERCDGDVPMMVSALTTALAKIAMETTGNNRDAAENFIMNVVTPGIAIGLDVVEAEQIARRPASGLC